MNARPLRIIDVPAAEIIDWESFHDVFARVFQFADYYGRNFNARIDLMTYLDLEGQVDALVVPPGTLVGLRLRGAESFAARAPELYQAIIDGVTFVNFRREEMGEEPLLSLLPS